MALRLSCLLSRRASLGALLVLTACGRSDLDVLDTFARPPSLGIDEPATTGQGGHPGGGQAGVSGHAGAQAGATSGGHAGSSTGGHAGLGGTGAMGEQGGAGAPFGQGGAGGASGAGASGGMGVGGSLGGAGGSLFGAGGVGGSPTGAGGSPGGAGGVSTGAGGAGQGGVGQGGVAGLSGTSGQSGAGQGGAGQGGALVQQANLVSLSEHHACAHLAGGGIKCWGNNSSGQLGLGDDQWRGDQPGEMGAALPFVDLGSGVKATGVSVLSNGSSCALFADGQVKCWGGGVYGIKPGQMGDVLPFVRFGTGAQVTQLVSGDYFVCGLLATGQVKCWGDNTSGQLGLGEVLSWSKPAEMGDNLPALDLGTGLAVRSLAAGAQHTCALFTNGRVKCWGFNPHGELGLGDGLNRGDDDGEMGDALPFVDLGSGVQAAAVYAGVQDTCALLTDGRVKCWGFNEEGQLGLGDTNHRGDNPGEMGDALPFIDLGTNSKAVSLGLGRESRCALLEGGQLKCWGRNSAGELGLGDMNWRGDQPGEMGDALPFVDVGSAGKVVALHSGGLVHCARFDSGLLRCWGFRPGLISPVVPGELFAAIGDEPGEMGDNLIAIDLGAPIGP